MLNGRLALTVDQLHVIRHLPPELNCERTYRVLSGIFVPGDTVVAANGLGLFGHPGDRANRYADCETSGTRSTARYPDRQAVQ